MELDQLKSQINHRLSTDHAGRSANDFADMLTKKTASVTDKLKRSLWIEIISCIVIVLLFAYIGIWGKYTSFRIYFSVFAVLAFGFLVVVIHLLKKTKILTATPLPVKSNLQNIVTIIQEFMKRYFQFTMALIPVCIIFSFLLGYNEPATIPEVDKAASTLFAHAWQAIAFLVAYMILLSVGIYYFTRWYLKKLYGRYVEKLKECIHDLSEETSL